MRRFTSIIAMSLALGLASSVSAQRATDQPNKTYKRATSSEEIVAMEKGTRYAVVCRECDSVTIKEAGDKKDLEAMCHDGGSMHCPSCKKVYTVKSVGPRPGGASSMTKVTIVNAGGKECMFIVPMKG